MNDTPARLLPAAPTTAIETLRQTVRIALPADAAGDFELRLPGKVLPEPLRFERRRLDAGLAPFNC